MPPVTAYACLHTSSVSAAGVVMMTPHTPGGVIMTHPLHIICTLQSPSIYVRMRIVTHS